MDERVADGAPMLRHPRRFLGEARRDLRLARGGALVLLAANLRTRYRRTVLGYLWLLLPTAATALVWTYIQSRGVIALGRTEVPYAAHVLAGTVVWQLLVDSVNVPLQELGAKRQAVSRTTIPLEAIVMAGVLEVVVSCMLRLAVLVVALALIGVDIRASILLAPIGMAVTIALGLAVGLLLTPVGLLVEDVGRALGLLTAVWFILTPVVYVGRGGAIVRWNPATPVVVVTRGWLTGEPSGPGLLVVAVASLVVVIVAWLLLRLSRPHVIGRLG